MSERPRHREIRRQVEHALRESGYEAFSSHERGDVTLYRLTGSQSKGNSTAIKCPDILARKGGSSLIVEIELNNAPSTILGDIACVSISTHIAPTSDVDPIELPPSIVVVALDGSRIKPRLSKLRQFRLLEEAFRPDGLVRDVWILTHDQLIDRIRQD